MAKILGKGFGTMSVEDDSISEEERLFLVSLLSRLVTKYKTLGRKIRRVELTYSSGTTSD